MVPGQAGPVTGNLSHSMRDNYNSHGVDEYYRIVQESYRNPHYPGLKRVLAILMNRFTEHENPTEIKILDLAAGSGEATEALLAWRSSRWPETAPSSTATPTPLQPPPSAAAATLPSSARPPFVPAGRSFPSRAVARPPPRNLDASPAQRRPAPSLSITAADPFTSPAYRARTGFPCLELSFADVAAGLLPPPPPPPSMGSAAQAPTSAQDNQDESVEPYDLVVISFALHLVESSSELWALLTELSKRAKWLCVTAPHKKPDVKDSWGWRRWDPSSAWKPAEGRGNVGGTEGDGFEIVLDRVRLRLWRSETLWENVDR
ncbi:hypothetical protein JCM3774_005119 [Rhodotorula dairenensis]